MPITPMLHNTVKQNLFFLSSFLIISLFSTCLSADRVKQSIDEKKLIPECLIAWEKGPDYAVLVDKSRQKVFVYSREDLFNPYKVFNCSTGKNKGPKSRENDAKTPEGIYFFTDSVDDKYLTPVYGSHALPIDYPNIADRTEGKGGYGIWFHGINKVLKPYDSNGCVEMENIDIKELAGLITLFETPVVISSNLEMVPEDRLEDKRGDLTGIIDEWLISWNEKDIDEYMSFYSEKFSSEGKDRAGWKEYRSELAKKNESIDVEINNLLILHNNGIIVTSFDQVYKTPSENTYSRKRLYLTREKSRWKIIGEITVEEQNP